MNIRLAITITVIVLLVGGSITITMQMRKIALLHQENEQLVKVASDSGRIARTYINLYGQAISKNNVLDLTLRNARAIQAQELAFIRQFEGVKKNLKNLEAAFHSHSKVLINLKLKTRDTTIVNIGPSPFGEGGQRAPALPVGRDEADTIPAKSLYYQDDYNFVSGLITADSAQLYAEIEVPIDGVTYWQRKHKFIFKNWRIGKKQYFSEMTSANPWVHITQHEFINIGRKK